MLSNAEKLKFLRTCPLFTHLSEKDLKNLVPLFKVISYQEDQTIFEEGEEGDAMYLIVAGQVRIHKDGVEIVIFGSGGCLGEFSILDNAPRAASATTISEALLLRIDRKDFENLAAKNMALCRGMFKVLVHKLNSDTKVMIEEARRQERVNQDLKRAHEIQNFMLPEKPPDIANLDISAYYQPADRVGGDYYDFFELPSGELVVAIGDATGHGFYTGLMAAMVRSCLHTQIKSDSSIPQVMRALNEMIHKLKKTKVLMTFCYAIINPKRYTMKISDAGHNFPYHYISKKKAIKQIECISYPLGVLAERPFPQLQVKFEKHDLLVFYSDGIIESEDRYGEQFGEERFEKVLMDNAHFTAEQIKSQVLSEHESFCATAAQSDDITLVIIKIK
jgi:sigma-B regulation protein RsbU (phosphoserine phosphatase)